VRDFVGMMADPRESTAEGVRQNSPTTIDLGLRQIVVREERLSRGF
jgi:hypothetical protein